MVNSTTKRAGWKETRKQGIYFGLEGRFNDLDSELGKRGYFCQEIIQQKDVPVALRYLARNSHEGRDMFMIPLRLVARGFKEGSYAVYRRID